MQLSPMQGMAVKAIEDWFKNESRKQVFTLAGFAGSGKSTIVPDIMEALGLLPDDVAFLTPTGKSALVVSQKLQAAGIKAYATTIHKAIYRPRSEMVDKLERLLSHLREQMGDMNHLGGNEEKIRELQTMIVQKERELDDAYGDTSGPSFVLNMDADLGTRKLVLIDEASMVGSRIADDLMAFGVKILAVGDPGQLSPVKDDPGFDLVNPDFFLSEIHRQAQESPIIRLSMWAREGKTIDVGDYGDGVVVVSRKKDTATYDMTRNAQLLVGTNKTRWGITKNVRKALGYKSTGPVEGEPLIITKNSRNVPSIVNGMLVYVTKDVGDLVPGKASFVVSVETMEGSQRQLLCYQGQLEESLRGEAGFFSAPKALAYRSRIENEQLDWGHAITVHKSQGSQFEDVILHDESFVFRQESKRWLYTGITRAAKQLTIVV